MVLVGFTLTGITTLVSGFNTVVFFATIAATFIIVTLGTILAAGVSCGAARVGCLAVTTIRAPSRYAETVPYFRIGKLGYFRSTTTAGRFCCGRIRATTAGHLCFGFYDKAVIRTRKDKSCSEK